MALILKKAHEVYMFLFDELADPRTKSWPFVSKPYQGLALLGLYLMFVLKWGPKWMQNRRPFNLDKVLIAYNALQVLACLYLLVEGLRLAWLQRYKWICEPVDYSYSNNALAITRLCYFFFFLKTSDLLDTIFFVLRKKYNQVSFLHVYHHGGMFLIAWGVITYLPGGHGTLIGVINAVIHIVMYSYYLLTVAMPNIRNALWIKKMVTQLQIIQFFWCAVHMGMLVFRPDCEYPRWTAILILPQNIFMLVLFTDFYIKAYIVEPKRKLNNKDNLNSTTNSNDINNFNKISSQAGNKSVIENGKNKLSSTNGINKTNGHHKES